MKNKLLSLRPCAFAFIALLAASLLSGCNTITFEKQEVANGATNTVRVSNRRVFWNTDSYEATLSTNSASLKASKSSVDSVAIGAVAEGVARGLAGGAKP